LISHGHIIGEVVGKLRILNMPFLSQLRIGVMENNGAWFCSQPLAGDKNSSEKLKNTIELKNKIMLHDTFKVELEFFEHMDAIEKVIKILKSTDKGSQICFRFNTAEELTQMQASLIEFGNHLLKMKDFVAECVRP
jgi:hypothetical protein